MYGKRPDGFQSPYKTSAIALPASLPPRLAQTIWINESEIMKTNVGQENTDSGDIRVLNPRFKNEGSNTVCNDDRVVVLSRNSKDELIAFVPSRQILPVTYVPIDSYILLYQGQQRTGEQIIFRTSPESEFTKTMATSWSTTALAAASRSQLSKSHENIV